MSNHQQETALLQVQFHSASLLKTLLCLCILASHLLANTITYFSFRGHYERN
uniref:Uncharacterized protein n=1 Tax=Anguilla anguilla TaxID=7936 RepID=A0A0E9SCK6_ANGAN